MTLKEQIILEREKQKMRKKCESCGHTMSFYYFEKDKKICNHCGTLNYRNDSIKFKDKLLKEIKRCL